MDWHFAHGEGSDDVLFANATFFQTASFSGEMVAVVNAHSLIDGLPQIMENEAFDYSPDLIEQISQLDYEDNPVLALYTLK